MKLEVRYANHPEDSKYYTTEQLRRHYLMEKVFEEDEILLVYSHQDRIVLAADTIVVFNNQIYGKPKDELDAFSMLKKLQGNAHQVITAVAIKSEKGLTQGYSVSDVVFNKMTDEDILEYIKTKEPMDKAGSYAIQGIGGKYIKEYIGEFDNIVGLPIKVVKELLTKHI